MIKGKKQRDKTQLFYNAIIQHGPLSNRIYLMKMKQANPNLLINAMEKLAEENGYTKIFAKVPMNQSEEFLESGYIQEAEIPGFYHGQETALFLGRFLDKNRQKDSSLPDNENILDIALEKEKNLPGPETLPAGAILRLCLPSDAGRISNLYRRVFESYPFPIDNPDYITETMMDNVVYFGIEIDKEFIALSSAEMDEISRNAEMTDFATLPEYRGNNLSGLLLAKMEKEMISREIHTAYTIARAISPGMNITFAKAGYSFGGRLVNNTNISGQIESMNVWHKRLLI